MKHKEFILQSIEDALVQVMTEPKDEFGIVVDDPEDAVQRIREFIRVLEGRYSESELKTKFTTWEEILDHYISYLESLLDIGDATIH